MNNRPTPAECDHLGRVKSLPCSVCDKPGPSDAHHISQACQYTVVALCEDCHRDPHNGIHGRKAMWKVRKMDEMAALNVTIRRLLEARG